MWLLVLVHVHGIEPLIMMKSVTPAEKTSLLKRSCVPRLRISGAM